MVVPLLHGAGVKFKTIEALLAGAPVVTTPIGAEGIGGPDLFARYTEDPYEFAMAVVDILMDGPDTHRRAAIQAGLWDKYSITKFRERVGQIYLAP